MKQLGCSHLGELVDEYIDGELPPAIQVAVAAHLEGCPSCRALVAHELAVLKGIRGALRVTAVPSWLEARVSAAIAFTAAFEELPDPPPTVRDGEP